MYSVVARFPPPKFDDTHYDFIHDLSTNVPSTTVSVDVFYKHVRGSSFSVSLFTALLKYHVVIGVVK